MTDLKEFRRCLGKFATGVTIVTCTDRDGNPCGITANSFSSVSLEPPLVLWSIAKVSDSLNAYLEAQHFAINILTNDQRQLSHHFAQSKHTLFDGVKMSISENGVVLFPDTLGCLECSTTQIHEAGDHFIIIGRVDSFAASQGEPLLFYNGDYAALGSD